MGGIFSAPKIEAPAPEPVIDTEEEERKKAMERRRRGMESTIKTSYKGVLQPTNSGDGLNRKNLLGE